MIKFHNTVTLEVIESFDEAEDSVDGNVLETFAANEPVQASIIDEQNGMCQLEFGDGSQAFCVPRNSFEVISE